MINKYGLNLEKTVFVVDSPVTAFMIAILSEGYPVHLVVERKTELETDRASELLMNFVRSCINIGTIEKVQLPHRFYISYRDVRKIWNIRQQTRNLYDAYTDDTIFVGSSTSTFMRALRCNSKNIIYLYHGMSDLINREDEFRAQHKKKNKLKSLFISKVIGLPNSTWSNFWPDRAFSMCKLKSDGEEWLNLDDFQSEIIAKSLSFLDAYKDDRKNVLFFPVIEGHTKKGVDSDVSSYDIFNYDFLFRHIVPERERIFIKHHPWLYRANDDKTTNLLSMVRQSGVEAYDIATMIPNEVGGVLLPTEVICRYAKIDKMIAEDTSTMWYTLGNKNIEKILDITRLSGDGRELMLNCFDKMKKKCDMIDIKFFY